MSRYKKHKQLGGILMVAGTAIGAGMLALPITTGTAGFGPSLLLFVVCFAYMLISLFYLLEANFYSTELEANIITMARDRLGVVGQMLAWVCFLMLLYAVAAAYLSGGGSLIAKFIDATTSWRVTPNVGIGLYVLVFGGIAFFGTWLVDYLNRFLMLGLIIAYLSLALFVLPHAHVHNWTVMRPQYLWYAVPIVALSFTSHVILPSLKTYFQNDFVQLKRVLIIGSLIPLVFYIVWQGVITGLLSLNHLVSVAAGPHPVAALTSILQKDLGFRWIALAVGTFSFFALVTSFLAVILSLSDFLADGFKIEKTGLGRVVLLILSLLPPLLFAIYYPHGFVVALSYAGVFVAVLYGILPTWMVWVARYKQGLRCAHPVPGGKPLLLVTFLGAWLIIGFQIAVVFKWLPTP